MAWKENEPTRDCKLQAWNSISNICQSHDIHNGTLQTSKIFQRRYLPYRTTKHGGFTSLGWAETLPVGSPVLWAAVASVHLQPPPLCSLPSSLLEYPWWRWNSPPERDARCKLWVGRPKWPVGRIETWKCSKKYKNLDVFPGIWIIIWIIIWDLLLNLVMSLMTLCSLILRCPVKVLQSPASIVQSWRQSSTDTESWTTSSGRNLLSVQIGLSEVPIVLNSTILLAFYYVMQGYSCLRSTATWSSSWIWTTHWIRTSDITTSIKGLPFLESPRFASISNPTWHCESSLCKRGERKSLHSSSWALTDSNMPCILTILS